MLLELNVSHFAVIDSLKVHFLRPGLNVLTGETGAGKSILIKSLSLLMGGKASPDVIRTGFEQAVIEGAFDLTYRPDIRNSLKELAMDSGEETLVVRRIISNTGKHRIYINGNLSTLNVLESLLTRLVEITGQHEHHSLIKPISQLNVLDDFASLLELRKKFSSQFQALHQLETEIADIESSAKEREQRLEFLRFQVKEIETFNPTPGEDQDLQTRYQRARFSSRLFAFSEKSENILYANEDSVHSALSQLIHEGESLADLDPKLKKDLQTLREASVLVEDAAFGFREYSKTEIPDPNELERLEARVSDLKKLQKKYGNSLDEILEFKIKTTSEIEKLEKSDDSLKDLLSRKAELQNDLKIMAKELHEKRVKAARRLGDGVNKQLQELNMKGVQFSANLTPLENLASTGGDLVEFMFKPSPKDQARPLSKVASGGELSRLMLAIKQVIAASETPMTYLFDEVDTGVSGPTAEKVGKKLKSIGKRHQVVCITHLPQVASFGDAHFLINKEVVKGFVKSEVKELTQKERVRELGRMISGEKITSASLTHAQEMLDSHL